MVVIPKATLIERIHSRSGPEAADSANEELPDHLMLQSSAIMALFGLWPLRQQKEMEDAVCS